MKELSLFWELSPDTFKKPPDFTPLLILLGVPEMPSPGEQALLVWAEDIFLFLFYYSIDIGPYSLYIKYTQQLSPLSPPRRNTHWFLALHTFALLQATFPMPLVSYYWNIVLGRSHLPPTLLLLTLISSHWQHVPQKEGQIKLNKCKITYKIIYSYVQKTEKILKSDIQRLFRTWEYWETGMTSTSL